MWLIATIIDKNTAAPSWGVLFAAFIGMVVFYVGATYVTIGAPSYGMVVVQEMHDDR